MRPKEKSWQLIIKFQMKPSNLTKDDAKKSALIAIDEIMGSLELLPLASTKEYYELKKYWQEVKQELEKL